MSEKYNIPPFEATPEQPAFPEGNYTMVLGDITPEKENEDSPVISAVLQDIWVMSYNGTTDNIVEDVRISTVTTEQGKSVKFNTLRGIRLVERFPNTTIRKDMVWKLHAFYSKFKDCLVTKEDGKKSVVWDAVQNEIGRIFTVDLYYNTSKKNNKKYKNLKYDSICVTPSSLPASIVYEIENKYAEMLMEEEKRAEDLERGFLPPADLPF